MKVHIFEGSDSQYGFTRDPAGRNLPGGTRWTLLKSKTIQPTDVFVAGNGREIIAAIEADGCFVRTVKSRDLSGSWV